MSKRRTHSPEFKAKVAMEAISGRKTLKEIAAAHGVHPLHMEQWKNKTGVRSQLYTRGDNAWAKNGRAGMTSTGGELRRPLRRTPGHLAASLALSSA